MKTKTWILTPLFLMTFPAYSLQPYADSVTTGMFLQGTNYTIPSRYFQQDTANGDSYILTKCPYGASSCTDPITAGTSNWTISNLRWPDPPSRYDELNAGYPGFSEALFDASGRPIRGQCVAFGKVATNTENIGTSQWYANGKVQSATSYLYMDNSYQHQGKMIAYFPSGNGSRYPNGSNGYGHVGIFLKFQYPAPPFNSSYSVPVGFWIVDENYSGIGTYQNSDGKIRKHLIMFNSGNGHKNGSNYFFVDMR